MKMFIIVAFILLTCKMAYSQQTFYTDQKQNCSLPLYNGSFCYNSAVTVANQIKSCSIPGSFALTFDQSPSIYTSQILDILKQFNISATFFVVGNKIANYPTVIQRMLNEGHQVASHTFTHSLMVNTSYTDVQKDLLEWEKAMNPFNVSVPKLFRAPYGILDTTSTQAITDLGYTIINWGFIAGNSLNLTNQDIYNIYYSHLGGPNGSGVVPNNLTLITQQHDREPVTLSSLPQLATYLTSVFGQNGAKFTTVKDCLASYITPNMTVITPAVNSPSNMTSGASSTTISFIALLISTIFITSFMA